MAELLDLDPPPHSEAYERLEFLSVLVHTMGIPADLLISPGPAPNKGKEPPA